MTEVNRQIVLRSRPIGRIKESDFEYREAPLPEPGDGQVLVRNIYISVDPAIRGWAGDYKGNYITPIEIGAPIRSFTVGRVVRSNHADFATADLASDLLGWQDYAVADGASLEKVTHDLPMSATLSVLGLTGRTAYFGLLDVGRPEAGETVVVSAAAGAVGSVVGQIAKIRGCRVVGIAGSDQKCAWLIDDLGFDAAVNYKTDDVGEALAGACRDGIDVYFDNVGGETLDAVLGLINVGARLVICGVISYSNATEPVPGPYNLRALLAKRARMEGFIVLDYRDRYAEATAALAGWVKDRKIQYREQVLEGLEQAPKAINRLFDGTNEGKLMVAITGET